MARSPRWREEKAYGDAYLPVSDGISFGHLRSVSSTEITGT